MLRFGQGMLPNRRLLPSGRVERPLKETRR